MHRDLNHTKCEVRNLIGLSDEQRTGGMDPLARFRKMAQESENGAKHYRD